MQKIRVMIWGFGAMGSGIARALLTKKGVEIVGVFDLWDEIVGKEIHTLLELERGEHPEVFVQKDAYEGIKPGAADIVILATDSFTRKAYDKIAHCVKQGINVISTAEEMSWPWAQEPELARDLDRLARQHHVSILGTGVNPGFVLDYLILALTGCLIDVDHIDAARINDLSPFGKAVMEEQGVGITTEEFERRLAADDLAGHVGFPESISIIAAGLGIDLPKIEQTKEPIVSKTERETPYAKVAPGAVAGIRQQGKGYTADGDLFINLDHPQQIRPEKEGVHTGDFINITSGDYQLKMAIEPEIPGGVGTIAMCVNMVPHVINAEPGLKNLLDMPVPRALLGDMAKMIKGNTEPVRSFKAGDLVYIEKIVLPAGERAPSVPEDTAKVPLIAYCKGFLKEDAMTGDEAVIETFIGREVKGRVMSKDPAYVHTYGDVVPELLKISRSVREITRKEVD